MDAAHSVDIHGRTGGEIRLRHTDETPGTAGGACPPPMYSWPATTLLICQAKYCISTADKSSTVNRLPSNVFCTLTKKPDGTAPIQRFFRQVILWRLLFHFQEASDPSKQLFRLFPQTDHVFGSWQIVQFLLTLQVIVYVSGAHRMHHFIHLSLHDERGNLNLRNLGD